MLQLFRHRFSQNIWRILPHPDAERNEWAFELREISEKKTLFALIDASTEALRWITAGDETDWWASVTAFAHDRLLVHGYRYPELPEPTDIIALDAATGKRCWELPNCVFVTALGDGLIEVAPKPEQGTRWAIRALDGSRADRGRAKDNDAPIILKLPVRYKESNPYFGSLASFIGTILNIDNPVLVDYLEHRPYMVFSYYLYQQDKMSQFLLVVDENKAVMWHEQLSESRDGAGESNLMLKGDALVYVKNSNEFSLLKLS